MKHSRNGDRADDRQPDRHRDSERLQRLGTRLGLDITEEQAGLLICHLDRVLEANRRFNLTRIEERGRALETHVIDSLAAVPHLAGLAAEDEVADLGSGAGFPGIPIAVMLKRKVTLIESIGKKASFLAELANEMAESVQITVFPGRAEELASREGGRFAVVTARAVAGLPSLVELASPLLRDGGLLVALKGSPQPSELASGAKAASSVGMEEIGRFPFQLPESGHKRMIVSYVRSGESETRLPRRTGLAQRRPLA